MQTAEFIWRTEFNHVACLDDRPKQSKKSSLFAASIFAEFIRSNKDNKTHLSDHFFSFLLKSFRRIFFFSWHFCGKFGKSRMKSRGNEIHSNEWAWVRAPTHSTYMANGVRFVSLLCCVSHWRLWVILWWLIVDSRQLKRHRCALPNKSSEIEMFESRLLVIQCAMKSKRKAYAPIKRISFFFFFLYL